MSESVMKGDEPRQSRRDLAGPIPSPRDWLEQLLLRWRAETEEGRSADLAPQN
jgi:hypothetical protein